MKIKIPSIAKGCVLPYSVQEKLAKEKQNKKKHKKQVWHSYNVTFVGAIAGAIASVAVTYIVANWSKIIDFITKTINFVVKIVSK